MVRADRGTPTEPHSLISRTQFLTDVDDLGLYSAPMPGNFHPNRNPRRSPAVQPGDFARLGIGVQEARVSVIRRAASNATAEVKANVNPDVGGYVDQQLAEIAASTYRLLDPRGRNALIERVQLMHFESTLANIPPGWNSTRPPKTTEVFKDRFDPSAMDETYVPRASISETLSRNLFGRLPNESFDPRMLSLGAGILVVLVITLSLARLGNDEPPSQEPPLQVVPVEQNPLLPQQSVQALDQETHPKEEADLDEAPMTMIDEVQELDREKLMTVTQESFSVSQAESGLQQLLDETFASIELPAELSPTISPERGGPVEETPLQERETIETESPKTESRVSSGQSDAAENAMETVSSDETDEAQEPDTDQRFSIPLANEILEAEGRLQRVIANLPQAKSDIEKIENIRGLRQTAASSAPGSTDRYVILLETGRRFVLMGRRDDGVRTLDELNQQYRTDPGALELSILNSVAASAVTITEKERVVHWALFVSDQAMRRSELEPAAEATRLASALAVQLGDVDLRARLKQCSESIRQAKRMTTTVEQALQVPQEDIASSTANLVGRYLCFYQRDWETGLPWLARSSSRKLALVATQERDQTMDRLELIAAWLENAKEQRGRIQDSILLHARDIAQSALSEAVGLEAEELKQALSEIDGELPKDLQLPTKSAAPAPAPGNPLMTNPVGMLGRLSADGIDVGAVIYYKPGLLLTRDAFSQILGQLNVDAKTIALDFVGMINVPRATTVQVAAGGVTSIRDVTVQIDDRPVVLSRDGDRERMIGTVDLPPGTFVVRWRFSGKNIKGCHFAIQDDRLKQRLDVTHSPSLLQQVVGNARPRLTVRILGVN